MQAVQKYAKHAMPQIVCRRVEACTGTRLDLDMSSTVR